MLELEFQLTNDDEPGKMSPRRLRVVGLDKTVSGQPAVVGRVDPPLTGDGWGNGTSDVLLISRSRGVSISEIVIDADKRPARVYVCRYRGELPEVPDDMGREDVSIEFWGLLE